MLWLLEANALRKIHVISFELTQHIRPRYVNVTDRQTDVQTDGRWTYDSNTAQHYVHRAVKASHKSRVF